MSEKFSDEDLKEIAGETWGIANIKTPTVPAQLARELLDTRADLAALKAANEWMNVEDGYPEKEYKDLGDEVLVELDYPYSRVAPMAFDRLDDEPLFFTGGYGTCIHNWTKLVLRWRYLPEPPEVGE